MGKLDELMKHQANMDASLGVGYDTGHRPRRDVARPRPARAGPAPGSVQEPEAGRGPSSRRSSRTLPSLARSSSPRPCSASPTR